MTNETSTSGQSPEELFQERIRRVEDAVSLKEGTGYHLLPLTVRSPIFSTVQLSVTACTTTRKPPGQSSASTMTSSLTQISTRDLPAEKPMNWPAPP